MWGTIISNLIAQLAVGMASFTGRAMVAAGIGFTTFTGITVAISVFKTQAINSINAMGADAVGLLGYLWIDKALTLIFSAIVASMALKAIGGTIKKVGFKT